MATRSCKFCSGNHTTENHICGNCKKIGHSGLQRHCGRCKSTEHTEEVHKCLRYECHLLTEHTHSCLHCLELHPTENHVCSECKQLGHYWGNCKYMTFCTTCNGKVGHDIRWHNVCKHCNKDDFLRHMACPMSKCSGCAIEQKLARLGEDDHSVKCNKCNKWWEDLDCVLYEWMGQCK